MSESVRVRAHAALGALDFAPLSVDSAATYDAFITRALTEDVGLGDVTTDAIVDAGATAHGIIVARKPGVAAGIPIAIRVFNLVDARIVARPLVIDGSLVRAGTRLIDLTGPARGILTGERVALNILGRLCGIATLTRAYVDAVTRPYAARIADTRKTTPGMRMLERYAVRAGGGVNHRFNLFSAILIKDNHLETVDGVSEAVRRARLAAGDRLAVEVECESLEQVREALEAGADSLLLDNMDDAHLREAVSVIGGRAIVEASGGMTLERVPAVAAAGVDIISVGALTHSVSSLDVALDFQPHKGTVN
jgi:nicotinate-nucleotide pyrophosphorylase (carboxylating)